MTRYQVWDAVINSRAGFLPAAFVARDLEPLISRIRRVAVKT
jgi:hypothetical protein